MKLEEKHQVLHQWEAFVIKNILFDFVRHFFGDDCWWSVLYLNMNVSSSFAIQPTSIMYIFIFYNSLPIDSQKLLTNFSKIKSPILNRHSTYCICNVTSTTTNTYINLKYIRDVVGDLKIAPNLETLLICSLVGCDAQAILI